MTIGKRKSEKILISNSALTIILSRKVQTYPECRTGVPVAIVPDRRLGWKALTAPYVVRRYPLCAKRVEQVQRELRQTYGLAKD